MSFEKHRDTSERGPLEIADLLIRLQCGPLALAAILPHGPLRSIACLLAVGLWLRAAVLALPYFA
jgi:hypothetical protein